MDQTKCWMIVMLPAASLPVSTMFKAAPRKSQVNFSSFFFFCSSLQNVLLQRHSGEWGWPRRSIFCLVSWNSFEVSVTLETHQHMAEGKVRLSLRVGTSSMFWRISLFGPWSVIPCRSSVLLMTMLTDTQLIRETWNYSALCVRFADCLCIVAKASTQRGLKLLL